MFKTSLLLLKEARNACLLFVQGYRVAMCNLHRSGYSAYNNYTQLACTCGNSTACVCYLKWKPVAPPSPPPKQTDGPVGKAGLRSANTKHLEAIAMLLITPNRGT